MNPDIEPARLRRLERKVNHLMWMMRLQTALLGLVVIAYLLQMSTRLFLILLVVVPLLVLFRRSLPHWARKLGSYFASGAERDVNVTKVP